MEGGLEAKIHEGGKRCIFTHVVLPSHFWACALCRLLHVPSVLCAAKWCVYGVLHGHILGSTAVQHGKSAVYLDCSRSGTRCRRPPRALSRIHSTEHSGWMASLGISLGRCQGALKVGLNCNPRHR